MSDNMYEPKERSITVGYLKQLFERLNLPDDAVMYYAQPYMVSGGWVTVGPEGEELVFINPEAYRDLMHKATDARIDGKIMGWTIEDYRDSLIGQYKQRTGQ